MRRALTSNVLAMVILTGSVVALMDTAPAFSQAQSDTLSIIKDQTLPSNADIARDIAEATFTTVDTVLVARDDDFADALASGVIQSEASLLLVPSAGPIPPDTVDTIGRLDASRAVVLGGEAAVAPSVAQQLTDLGLAVERRDGGTRFDTAVTIARTDAPVADTLMLARAFPAEGSSDLSQGFADTLAAGGIAARLGIPILLTQTDVLTGPTRDYIAQSGAGRVLVLGGTAAISEGVMAEVAALGVAVERIAGASRDATATEIAKVGGDASAADAARVIITDGQGPQAWAAGFALAAHAAVFDAPIVLTAGTVVPPSTEAFLATGIGGDPAVAPVMTCAVLPQTCEIARVTAQLPPRSLQAVGPIPFDLTEGQTEVVTVDGVAGDLASIGYADLATDDPAGTCVAVRLIAPDDRVVQRLVSTLSNCTDEQRRDGTEAAEVLTVTGTHRLEITAVDGPVSGHAWVHPVVPVTIAMDGDPHSVDLSDPGEVHRAEFQASAGDLVGLGYEDLQTVGLDGMCIKLLLRSPHGDRLEGLDSGISNCVDRDRRDGLTEAVQIPETGTYTLETAFTDESSSGDRSGSATIHLTSVVPVPITRGGPGVPVDLDRPGEVHRASFTGTAGESLSFGYADLQTSGLDGMCIKLRLRSPRGDRLEGLDSGVSNCVDRDTAAESDLVQLTESGTWYLETAFVDDASSGDRPGSATIFLR